MQLCGNSSARSLLSIKRCFDNIRHDWILKNIPINKTILNKWLKSGYIEKKRLFPTKKGTPQGGTISPLIMNMVLDGLETIIMNKFPRWKRQKVNFIRYADDFVITAIDKQTIKRDIIPLVKEFLAERVKVKAKANPFLPEYDRYFYQRTKWREDLAKECKQITTFMSSKNRIKQPGVTSPCTPLKCLSCMAYAEASA